ncbi:MAG: hypothetical protein FJ333_11175 [Sphingomonadales bacterium]|nr:hypothetical protein [Sphingomonadales bacterium]
MMLVHTMLLLQMLVLLMLVLMMLVLLMLVLLMLVLLMLVLLMPVLFTTQLQVNLYSTGLVTEIGWFSVLRHSSPNPTTSNILMAGDKFVVHPATKKGSHFEFIKKELKKFVY